MKKVDSKKRVSAKDADRKGGKGMEYPAPKLPPLPSFKKVSSSNTSPTQKAPARPVKKRIPTKPALRKKAGGARASVAQQPDLAAQVSELQAQIAALKALVEHPQASASQVSGLQSQVSASSPVTSNPLPGPAAPQPPTSYSPLHPAADAQLEGGSQPSTLDSGPTASIATLSEQIAALRASLEHPQASASQVSSFQSQPSASSPATDFPVSGLKSQVSSSIPIYELKQTRPVGYQTSDLLDSSSEESQDGFFTGLLDRARLQWLMGDWEGLGMIRLEAIKAHPDKARLALLAAAGCLQTGKFIEGKIFMRMALDWGANRRMAAMFLVSGAHHSIGKAAIVAKDAQRGALHFERAKTAIDFPGNSNQQKHISYRAQFSQG